MYTKICYNIFRGGTMSIGIYKITNKVNGKSYIGQSVNIERRWTNHTSVSKNENNKKYMYPLSQAFRKYGMNNFSFEILEICEENDLTTRETYYYNKYNPEYCLTAPDENFFQNEETRRKISNSLKGRVPSEACQKAAKIANTGSNNSQSKKIKGVHLKTNNEVVFDAHVEAAQWVIDNSLCREGTKIRQVSHSISRNVNGGRKSAYGYKWENI